MEIYLWRHGEAQARALSGRDADRRLVPNGEIGVRKVAQAVLSRGSSPDKIFMSPYLRAAQTANILMEVFACRFPVEALPELASGTTGEKLCRSLFRRSDLPRSIALVGHMPDLSDIAGKLLKKKESILFAPGAVARIELARLEQGTGTLNWTISPSDLIY